jgi:hypothetical protein
MRQGKDYAQRLDLSLVSDGVVDGLGDLGDGVLLGLGGGRAGHLVGGDGTEESEGSGRAGIERIGRIKSEKACEVEGGDEMGTGEMTRRKEGRGRRSD